MNPGILFLPVFRASMTAYLLGLVGLALLDFWRLNSAIPQQFLGLSAILIWFFVISLHANRRRYVDRGAAIAILPVALAALAKILVGLGAMVVAMFDMMRDFAVENGVDATSEEALAAAMSDPGFMAAFQSHLEQNPELAEPLLAAGSTPSFLAFWLVIAVFIPWFAQLKRRGGRIDPKDETPSMLNPAPIASQSTAPVDPAPEPAQEPVPSSAPEPVADPIAEPVAVPGPEVEAEAAEEPISQPGSSENPESSESAEGADTDTPEAAKADEDEVDPSDAVSEPVEAEEAVPNADPASDETSSDTKPS